MAAYVLVHGMLHGGWCWAPVARELEARGHRTTCVDLPFTTLGDDAAAAADACAPMGEPVVLVGHSYGGAVISRAAGGRDDVAQLVYVAAFLLEGDRDPATGIGEAHTDLAGHLVFPGDGTVSITPEGATSCFYGRCDPADAAAAVARLRPTAMACLTEAPGAEPWRTIPTTYLVCGEDAAIHPDLQRDMATRARRVVELATDHSPFLSMRAEVVDLLDGLS